MINPAVLIKDVILPTALMLSSTLFYDNSTIFDKSVKCYGVYGCFPIDGQWITENRIFSLPPMSPAQINPSFPVFTKMSQKLIKYINLLDPFGVSEMGINPNGNIYFISHGFLDSGFASWVEKLTNKLLENDKSATVVVVDWHNGSQKAYSQAVANIRLVGAILAHVINTMYEELQLKNLNKVHLIGHSLGAHLSGYAGDILQKDFGLKVGRITGLDPAGPFFLDVNRVVRLDESDAKFVDVIHSDVHQLVDLGFGMQMPCGHIDFYPNGGLNNPGCNMMDLKDPAFIYCNHMRSIEFFTDSIKSNCRQYLAIKCESYEKFMSGECFRCDNAYHPCFEFGFNSFTSYQRYLQHGYKFSKSTPLQAYLLTGDKEPYCRYHYKLTVHMTPLNSSFNSTEDISTEYQVNLENNGEVEFSPNSNHFKPGSSYTALLTASNVGVPSAVNFKWKFERSWVQPWTWRIEKPFIFVEQIDLESMEYGVKLELCPLKNDAITSEDSVNYSEKYCVKKNL